MLCINLLKMRLIFLFFASFFCCGSIFVNCSNFILDKINDIASFVCSMLLDFYITCKLHSILFILSRVNKCHFISRVK